MYKYIRLVGRTGSLVASLGFCDFHWSDSQVWGVQRLLILGTRSDGWKKWRTGAQCCNAWCTGIDVDTAPQEKSRENGNVYSIEVQQNTTVRPNLSANWNWKTARIWGVGAAIGSSGRGAVGHRNLASQQVTVWRVVTVAALQIPFVGNFELQHDSFPVKKTCFFLGGGTVFKT